jgi:hypothetical protein
MTKEQRERYLRQDIHALRVTKFKWTVDQFKALLKELDFGESLTALDEMILTELKLILMRVRITGKPDEYTYDQQGMYMHSLMKRAGWDEYSLRTFLITHYHKSHWNLLDANQRKAVIAMFQKYVAKRSQAAAEQDALQDYDQNPIPDLNPNKEHNLENKKKTKSNKAKINQEVSNGNEPREK